jgi:hypothetical protein
MKKIVRLTESDLNRLVRKVLNEQTIPDGGQPANCLMEQFPSLKQMPQSCVGILGSIPKTPEEVIFFPMKIAACSRDLKQASGISNEGELMKKITAVQSCMVKKY